MPEQRPKQPEQGVHQSAGQMPDLEAYWRTLVRRRWLAIPFLVAAVVATGVATARQTKIYDSTCTIIIDLQAPRVLDKDQMQDVVDSGTGSFFYAREYYETQYKVIMSRAVAQRVLDRLQLVENPKFLGIDGVTDPAELEQRRKWLDPVKKLLDGLRVEPVKDSRIVRVRFEDRDPAFAAVVANAFAEAYIAENLSVKTVTTASAAQWLEGQLAELEKKLDSSGTALFDFKRRHDIVAASWEDRQSMVSQRLTAINDALTRAQVKKAELRARDESMAALGDALSRGGSAIEALQPVASNQAIQQIKARYVEALADCADLRVKYLEDHPRLEACEKKKAVAADAIRNEIKTALQAARNEFQDVAKTEANLRTLLDQTKSEAFALNQFEREYMELKRTHDNNQRLYEMVLKRLKDTGVTGLLQVSNVRILDRAIPNTRPVRPDVLRNMLLALFVGIIGGIGLAFGADYVDRSVTNQDQIHDLGLTFLGIVPVIARTKSGSPQDLFVHTDPKSAVAECLRAVRTNLLFMSPEKPLKTILVTSSGPQEGKTTTATSLAVTMAVSGNRVLLVDADMRRPRVHRIFGASNHAGLSSLIVGDGSLATLVCETIVPNLWLLPCGPVPPNPAELLHTTAFQQLVEEMSRQFDRVIIDSPPVGVVADAVVIGTQVDGTLIVIKAGQTNRDVARQAVRQLKDVNAPVFGAVLNNLDLNDQKYGQYSYYYRYGYYYGDVKPAEIRDGEA